MVESCKILKRESREKLKRNGWQVARFIEKDDHGSTVKHFDKFELVQPGTLSAAEYKERVADITNFMVYAAEPGRNRRIALGFGVLGFVLIFGILAYMLKVEYWKDVH